MDSNLKFKLKEGALKAQIEYLKSPNKGCNARDLKSRYEALLNEKNNLSEHCKSLNTKINNLNNKIDELNKDFANLNLEYNKILNSSWWKLTKPGRKICNLFKKTKSVHITDSNENTQEPCFDNLFPGENINIKDFMDFNIAKKQTEIKFDKNEKLSVVVPLFNTKINYLKEMIDSVRNQTYKNFELILSDASDKNHEYIKDYCEEIIKLDNRIKYIKLEKNGGISNNTNEAIKISTGNYIGFLDHDDILHPACLFECMLAINNHNADFIYTDHLIFQNDNLRDNPFIYYKPDFSPDTLRSLNCIGHFNLIKKMLLDKVGWLKSEFDRAQDYDIAFRATEKAKNIIHIPKLLYYFRACDTSSEINPQSKPYMHNADIKALQEHIDRLGLKGTAVKLNESNGLHNVNYEIKGDPLVSIIIPNKDHAYDLFRCINSIEEKSSYKNYEIIIVENNSSDPLIFEYYKELEKQENINIIEYKDKFNYSAINNFAVNHANGDYLLFLNNDIEIINEDWIERLLMFAQRKDIGCVGAKLFYPNDKIQHGGVVVGFNGVAGASFLDCDKDDPGYTGRLLYPNNQLAVTAACMMLKKEIFKKINGFDEKNFKIAFNDVDLCLKVYEAGYFNVFQPFCKAYHYESISRGLDESEASRKRFESEVNNFLNKWSKYLTGNRDPFYNVNLNYQDPNAMTYIVEFKPYNFDFENMR